MSLVDRLIVFCASELDENLVFIVARINQILDISRLRQMLGW